MNPGIKLTQESPISPQKQDICLCGISETRVLSRTLRPAHLGEPRCGKWKGATVSQGLEMPGNKGPHCPRWKAGGWVSYHHRCFSTCAALVPFPNCFYMYHFTQNIPLSHKHSHVSRLRIGGLTDFRKVRELVRDKEA